MFIKVRLLKGYPQPLWYHVEKHMHDNDELVGKIVRVPLRTQQVSALVVSAQCKKPTNISFAIRSITDFEPFPQDEGFTAFINKVATYYAIQPTLLVKRLHAFLDMKEQKESHEENQSPGTHHTALTDEQRAASEFISAAIKKHQYTPTVLHGVTGSGKTEIYKVAMKDALEQNKSVILLLPEVTLAIQFFNIFKAAFPSQHIFGFHSGTPTQEKRTLWKSLIHKKPVIVIGVHLPILLPIGNLGCIIIDEEHEVGYQEKKHPRLNSKEVALIRAQTYNIPTVLGSATPSIATLYNVHHNNWHLFSITKRFNGAFPNIQQTILSDGRKRRFFWVSTPLQKALTDTLAAQEQAIIFLNRRGHSFFVQCKHCSFTFNCTRCSVSLTLHANNLLCCHYCDYNITVPPACPECTASDASFLKKGIGTQQMVTILESLFPYARIARADMDTSKNKRVWKQTMKAFSEGSIDILVGTQTITKGHHFPNVTLVGVIWADLNLHFPVYNATETTLQQLLQVAGRAGRSTQQSTVIIQTMGQHPAFNFLNETDYLKFYDQEIETRKAIGYPPCLRLVEIDLKHTDQTTVDIEARALCASMKEHSLSEQAIILGPAIPPVEKLKNVFSRKIYLKTQHFGIARELYLQARKRCTLTKSSIWFTPNPL